MSFDKMKVFNKKKFLFRITRAQFRTSCISCCKPYGYRSIQLFYMVCSLFSLQTLFISVRSLLIILRNGTRTGGGTISIWWQRVEHIRMEEWFGWDISTFFFLRSTLKSHLNNITWLKESQIQGLNSSIDGAQLKYPLKTGLNNYLNEITPMLDANMSFGENFLNKYRWYLKLQIQLILYNKPIDVELSDQHYYFYLPFSHLIPPYFHPKYPISVKYALVGTRFIWKISRNPAFDKLYKTDMKSSKGRVAGKRCNIQSNL